MIKSGNRCQQPPVCCHFEGIGIVRLGITEDAFLANFQTLIDSLNNLWEAENPDNPSRISSNQWGIDMASEMIGLFVKENFVIEKTLNFSIEGFLNWQLYTRWKPECESTLHRPCSLVLRIIKEKTRTIVNVREGDLSSKTICYLNNCPNTK